MPFYIKFLDDSNDALITGDVQSIGYKKWIECDSLDFALQRAVKTDGNLPPSYRIGELSHQAIHLRKALDSASPYLYQATCEGTVFPSVAIHACKASQDHSSYIEYTLSKVIISGYHQSAQKNPVTGDDTIYEEIVLDPTQFQFKQVSRDSLNKARNPVATTYNILTREIV